MDYQEALEKLKHTSPLKITVSGDIGAGKSTFAKHLAEILDIPRIYMGQFMREEAAKRKITLDALGKLFEKDPELDRQLDELQSERSRYVQRGVFEGRTSWHFVENPTVKIFLSVDPQIATERIWQDRSDKRDQYSTIEALHKANQKRKESEIYRYKTYYGIDVYDTNNYDLVIDTTDLDIDQVFEQAVIKIAEYVA
ncbi:cytidylate kinase family protein [Patescibacteria group bacterium]|nr:cytidylate kinase family protein [Patescibacteria group bacterium]MCG2687801.1 cytidylate kinase family protein [Candidatus Parcubacteria bacterium]